MQTVGNQHKGEILEKKAPCVETQGSESHWPSLHKHASKKRVKSKLERVEKQNPTNLEFYIE